MKLPVIVGVFLMLSGVVQADDKMNPSVVEAHQYVDGILQKLVGQASRQIQYDLTISSSDIINASAAPLDQKDLWVNVYKGLLSLLQDQHGEDALAYVLAHELGHYYNEDTQKIKDIANEKDPAKKMQMRIQARSYSQKQEYEADNFAIRLMIKAGYNPKGAISLLKKFRDMGEKSGMLAIISTHPASDDRILNIVTLVKELEKTENMQFKDVNTPLGLSKENILQINRLYQQTELIKEGKIKEAYLSMENYKIGFEYASSLDIFLKALEKVESLDEKGYLESIFSILLKSTTWEYPNNEKAKQYTLKIQNMQKKLFADQAALFSKEINESIHSWENVDKYENFLQKKENAIYKNFPAESNYIFISSQLARFNRNAIFLNDLLEKHIEAISTPEQVIDLWDHSMEDLTMVSAGGMSKSNFIKLIVKSVPLIKSEILQAKLKRFPMYKLGILYDEKIESTVRDLDALTNELSKNFDEGKVRFNIASFDSFEVMKSIRSLLGSTNVLFMNFARKVFKEYEIKNKGKLSISDFMRVYSYYYSDQDNGEGYLSEKILGLGTMDEIIESMMNQDLSDRTPEEMIGSQAIADALLYRYVMIDIEKNKVTFSDQHIRNILYLAFSSTSKSNEKIAHQLKRSLTKFYERAANLSEKRELVFTIQENAKQLLEKNVGKNADIHLLHLIVDHLRGFASNIINSNEYLDFSKTLPDTQARLDDMLKLYSDTNYIEFKNPNNSKISDTENSSALFKVILMNFSDDSDFFILIESILSQTENSASKRLEYLSHLFDLRRMLSEEPEVSIKYGQAWIQDHASLDEKLSFFRDYCFIENAVVKRLNNLWKIEKVENHLALMESIVSNLSMSIETEADWNKSIDTIKALTFEIVRVSSFYLKGSQAETIVSNTQWILYGRWNAIPELKNRGNAEFVNSIQNYSYKYLTLLDLENNKVVESKNKISSSFTDEFYDIESIVNLKPWQLTEVLKKRQDPTKLDFIFEDSKRQELVKEIIASGRYSSAGEVAKFVAEVYPSAGDERDSIIHWYTKENHLTFEELAKFEKLHSSTQGNVKTDVVGLSVYPTLVKEMSIQANVEVFLWLNNIQDLQPGSEGQKAVAKYIRSEKASDDSNVHITLQNGGKFNSYEEFKSSFNLLNDDQKHKMLSYMLMSKTELLNNPTILEKLRTTFLQYANGDKANISVPAQLKLIYQSMVSSYESEVDFDVYRITLANFYASVFPFLAKIQDQPEKIATKILQEFGPIGDKTMQLLSEENLPTQYVQEFGKARSNAREITTFEALSWLDEYINQPEVKKQLVDMGVEGIEGKEVVLWNDVFDSVKQLGSASVKVVLSGKLKNGEKVAILIRRKNLKNQVEYSLKMIRKVMQEMISDMGNADGSFVIGMKVFVDRLDRELKKEIQFELEADNLEKLSNDIKEGDKVIKAKFSQKLGDHYDLEVSVPEVYVAHDGLMMTREVEGIKLQNTQELESAGIKIQDLYKKIIDECLEQVFLRGFAEFDRHQGNWIIEVQGEKPVIFLIDAGQASGISIEQRNVILDLFQAIQKKNIGDAAKQWKKMLDGESIETKSLENHLRDISFGDTMDAGQVLIEMLQFSVKSGQRIAEGYDSVLQLFKMLQNYSEKVDVNSSYFEKSFSVVGREYWNTQHPYLNAALSFYEKVQQRLLGNKQQIESNKVISSDSDNPVKNDIETSDSKDKKPQDPIDQMVDPLSELNAETPQRLLNQDVGRRSAEDFPAEYLISIEKFNSKITKDGNFYHGTDQVKNVEDIITNRFIESTNDSYYGNGVFASAEFQKVLRYTRPNGVVFELKLKQNPNLRILNFVDYSGSAKIYKSSEHYKMASQEAERLGVNINDYLASHYGIDVIIYGDRIIIKNQAAIEMPKDLRAMAKKYADDLQNKNISREDRIQKYKMLLRIIDFATKNEITQFAGFQMDFAAAEKNFIAEIKSEGSNSEVAELENILKTSLDSVKSSSSLDEQLSLLWPELEEVRKMKNDLNLETEPFIARRLLEALLTGSYPAWIQEEKDANPHIQKYAEAHLALMKKIQNIFRSYGYDTDISVNESYGNDFGEKLISMNQYRLVIKPHSGDPIYSIAKKYFSGELASEFKNFKIVMDPFFDESAHAALGDTFSLFMDIKGNMKDVLLGKVSEALIHEIRHFYINFKILKGIDTVNAVVFENENGFENIHEAYKNRFRSDEMFAYANNIKENDPSYKDILSDFAKLILQETQYILQNQEKVNITFTPHTSEHNYQVFSISYGPDHSKFVKLPIFENNVRVTDVKDLIYKTLIKLNHNAYEVLTQLSNIEKDPSHAQEYANKLYNVTKHDNPFDIQIPEQSNSDASLWNFVAQNVDGNQLPKPQEEIMENDDIDQMLDPMNQIKNAESNEDKHPEDEIKLKPSQSNDFDATDPDIQDPPPEDSNDRDRPISGDVDLSFVKSDLEKLQKLKTAAAEDIMEFLVFYGYTMETEFQDMTDVERLDVFAKQYGETHEKFRLFYEFNKHYIKKLDQIAKSKGFSTEIAVVFGEAGLKLKIKPTPDAAVYPILEKYFSGNIRSKIQDFTIILDPFLESETSAAVDSFYNLHIHLAQNHFQDILSGRLNISILHEVRHLYVNTKMLSSIDTVYAQEFQSPFGFSNIRSKLYNKHFRADELLGYADTIRREIDGGLSEYYINHRFQIFEGIALTILQETSEILRNRSQGFTQYLSPETLIHYGKDNAKKYTLLKNLSAEKDLSTEVYDNLIKLNHVSYEALVQLKKIKKLPKKDKKTAANKLYNLLKDEKSMATRDLGVLDEEYSKYVVQHSEFKLDQEFKDALKKSGIELTDDEVKMLEKLSVQGKLAYAMKKQWSNVISFLTSRHREAFFSPEQIRNAAQMAAASGNLEMVKTFASMQPKELCEDMLFEAGKNNQTNVIDYLSGLPDVGDIAMSRALVGAGTGGYWKLFLKLLNHPKSDWFSLAEAMDIASQNNKIAMVNYIVAIARFKDDPKQISKILQTGVNMSAYGSHVELVKYFANLQGVTEYDMAYGIEYATGQNREKIISYLCDHDKMTEKGLIFAVERLAYSDELDGIELVGNNDKMSRQGLQKALKNIGNRTPPMPDDQYQAVKDMINNHPKMKKGSGSRTFSFLGLGDWADRNSSEEPGLTRQAWDWIKGKFSSDDDDDGGGGGVATQEPSEEMEKLPTNQDLVDMGLPLEVEESGNLVVRDTHATGQAKAKEKPTAKLPVVELREIVQEIERRSTTEEKKNYFDSKKERLIELQNELIQDPEHRMEIIRTLGTASVASRALDQFKSEAIYEAPKFFAAMLLSHAALAVEDKGITFDMFVNLVRGFPKEMWMNAVSSVGSVGAVMLFDSFAPMISKKMANAYQTEIMEQFLIKSKGLNAYQMLSRESNLLHGFARNQFGMLGANIMSMIAFGDPNMSTEEFVYEAARSQITFLMAQGIVRGVALNGGLALGGDAFKTWLSKIRVGSSKTFITAVVFLAADMTVQRLFDDDINHLTTNVLLQKQISDGLKEWMKSKRTQDFPYVMQSMIAYWETLVFEPVQKITAKYEGLQDELDSDVEFVHMRNNSKSYPKWKGTLSAEKQNAINKLWQNYMSEAGEAQKNILDQISPSLIKQIKALRDTRQQLLDKANECNDKFIPLDQCADAEEELKAKIKRLRAAILSNGKEITMYPDDLDPLSVILKTRVIPKTMNVNEWLNLMIGVAKMARYQEQEQTLETIMQIAEGQYDVRAKPEKYMGVDEQVADGFRPSQIKKFVNPVLRRNVMTMVADEKDTVETIEKKIRERLMEIAYFSKCKNTTGEFKDAFMKQRKEVVDSAGYKAQKPRVESRMLNAYSGDWGILTDGGVNEESLLQTLDKYGALMLMPIIQEKKSNRFGKPYTKDLYTVPVTKGMLSPYLQATTCGQ